MAIIAAGIAFYMKPDMGQTPVTSTATPLIGTEWVWQKTVLVAGKEIASNDPSRFALAFGSDKRFTSTSDCNRLSGGFIVDGEVLSIGPIAATKMYCGDAMLESEYSQELSRATSYIIEGDELRINLLKDSGTMIFAKKAEAMTEPVVGNVNLNGSTFRLVSYNGKTIPSTEKYLITFEDSRINAKFCNSMGGEYTLKDGAIKSVMIGTQMYCGSPADVMVYESAFGSIMADGKLVQSGSDLTLTGADGKEMVFSVFMD